MTSFVDGQVLTGEQLDAAFAACFPAGGVSSYSATLVAKPNASQWLATLGLPSGTPGSANGLAVLDGSGHIPAGQAPTTFGAVTLGSGTTVFNSGADTNFFLYADTGHFAQTIYQINGVNQSAIGAAPAEPFFVFDSVNGKNIIAADASGNVTVGETGKTLTLNGYSTTSAILTDATTAGKAILTGASAAAQRTSLGLGSAAVASTGTSAGNVPVLDGSARMPAVDGSQMTGVTAVWPKGTLYGLTLSQASNTTIGITTGGAANEDSGTSFNMTLASAFTKSTSSWAVGSTHGGLFNGTIASNTWYNVYLIRKTSDGSIDAGFEVNYPPTHLPTGYAAYRRLGSVLTDGSSHFVDFTQIGDTFTWTAPVVDVNATNPGTAAVTATLTVPNDVVVNAHVDVGVYYNTSGNSVSAWLSPLFVTDTAPQAGSTSTLSGPADVAASLINSWGWSTKSILTNTSSQIRTRLSSSPVTAQLGIVTLGWDDRRGRS